MMVEAYKYSLFSVLSCIVLGLFVLILSGCTSNNQVINTYRMPGHKVSDMMNPYGSGVHGSKKNPVTRTKSGVYIYKDNSVINTTGYNFSVKSHSGIEPSDVSFDAEKMPTRY